MVHISIVRSTGKKFDFEISLEESVGALKEKLSSFFKIPANTIRLIYAGKEMKINKAKLSAFNVGRHENFNVHMLTTVVELGDDSVMNEISQVLKNEKNKPIHVVDAEEESTVISQGNQSANRSSVLTIDLTQSEPSDVSPSTSNRKRPREEKRASRSRNYCSEDTRQRIERAKSQRLYLIQQRELSSSHGISRTFVVLGSTGNVYDVNIAKIPYCSCPDFERGHLCKHILFVYLKVC